jgi:hypothetical protein
MEHPAVFGVSPVNHHLDHAENADNLVVAFHQFDAAEASAPHPQHPSRPAAVHCAALSQTLARNSCPLPVCR